MRKAAVRRLLYALFVAALAAAALGGGRLWQASLAPANIPLSARIANYDQVIGDIRHGLRVHASRITVRFSYDEDLLEELTAVVGDWVEQALAETGDPTEGDYIRYQYGGYEIECSSLAEGGRYQYTVEIVPEYYAYLVQEEAVTQRLAEVYETFGFDGETTDAEKLRTVYDYICANVRYDKVHRGHPYYHLKSTAYGALIQRTAACQGYCVLLYRMLREWGVNCRIVTGTARSGDHEEFHAWNLVELEGKWYCLDATWDAGQTEYRYFLRGTEAFRDHVPGPEFRDMLAEYPLSASDYAPR